jgi:chromosome segregation ATPase
MKIEITSQHSHELAAERGRAGELEDKLVSEKSKYHQLADELRRSEEMIKLEQHAVKEEREKSLKLSMQNSTLIRLRDDLRAKVSELEVQLSNIKSSTQSTFGNLETKNEEFTNLRRELEELKTYKKDQEEKGKNNKMKMQETKNMPNMNASENETSTEESQKTSSPSEISALSPSLLMSPSSQDSTSNALKNQLHATLTECSQLRKEVTILRMAISEKDFRLQALREIVGGLEKMAMPSK